MLAQAHTQAGNIKDAKEILVDFTPADDEDKRNALACWQSCRVLKKMSTPSSKPWQGPPRARPVETTPDTSTVCERGICLGKIAEKRLAKAFVASGGSNCCFTATKLDRDGAFSEAFDFGAERTRS